MQEETGLVYVSSGMGIEIFDPTTQTFSHYSRDRDMRVGSLAFANDGSLWAVTWPDRHQVVRVGDPLEPDSVLNPDVCVTNTGDSALVLPLLLVLDPPEGFQGVPLGATGQTADGEWLIALDGGPSSSVRLQPGETPVCFAPERRGGLQWAPQKRPARD